MGQPSTVYATGAEAVTFSPSVPASVLMKSQHTAWRTTTRAGPAGLVLSADVSGRAPQLRPHREREDVNVDGGELERSVEVEVCQLDADAAGGRGDCLPHRGAASGR